MSACCLRHRGFLHQLLGQRQPFAGEDEIGMLARPCVVAGLEFGEEGHERIHFRIDRRANAVPGQRFGERALADLLGIHFGGIGDVGNHSLMLGTLSGNPVELGQRELELAMVEGLDGLYRSLAEGLAAEDERTVVVLHGAREDFRS